MLSIKNINSLWVGDIPFCREVGKISSWEMKFQSITLIICFLIVCKLNHCILKLPFNLDSNQVAVVVNMLFGNICSKKAKKVNKCKCVINLIYPLLSF